RNNRIKIIYLTSGWHGVKEKFSIEQRKSIRIEEAINSARVLGINKKQLYFLDLPFYDKGKISARDIFLVEKKLKELRPQVIFACGESSDPCRTHGKCLKVIEKSLKKFKYRYRLVFYCVWSEFKLRQIKLFFPFGKEMMEKKILAIKAHRSQLNLSVTKSGISSFVKREEKSNRIYAALIKRKGFLKDKDFCYAEVFNLCSKKI
ncbi:MAG: hypothetical protein NTZ48_05120, partial [Candidatus Omnitrophica bacterium]|nr:hypothetical protein [Candidatus Omnitrophota bacterium]